MKIIDLLNKIANGEEVPPFSVYDETFYINNDYCNYIKSCDNEIVKWAINGDFLNQEIKIIEEEKKIPEKIPEEIIVGKKQPVHRIKKIEKKINEIISYLDYLKSKGE